MSPPLISFSEVAFSYSGANAHTHTHILYKHYKALLTALCHPIIVYSLIKIPITTQFKTNLSSLATFLLTLPSFSPFLPSHPSFHLTLPSISPFLPSHPSFLLTLPSFSPFLPSHPSFHLTLPSFLLTLPSLSPFLPSSSPSTTCMYGPTGKKKDYLFKDISFGIHPTSRIVLVGPNGAGAPSSCSIMCLVSCGCFPLSSFSIL